ncbi:Fic family protein [Flavobacteriaceae bacterium M23B6Z8]
MSNFHQWIINHDEQIKKNIITFVEKHSIKVSFLGYYIESNDKSYSMGPKPMYDTIKEYLKDNPKYGIIKHIRYFFALKKADEVHTMTAHLSENDRHHFLFSIEELAVEGTINDVSKTKGFEMVVPMLNKKFTPYLERIEKLHQTIIGHGKIDGDTLNKINYKLRLDWNYYSNRMEGGTLTRPETKQVMAGVSVASKPLNDVKEMSGHDKAVQQILHIAKGNLRISESRIKAMHKLIMSEDDEQKEALIGEWKEKNNEVINYKNEKQVFLDHKEVPERIHELLNQTNAELDAYFDPKKKSRHPLYIATDFHLDYLYIHPFYDGNGRTARLLTNLILISCGYPPIIITDSNKEVYYRLISDVQTYGTDKELFYSFMGKCLQETQQLILDALTGKDISEEDDFDKEVALLKNQLGSDENDIKMVLEDIDLHQFLDENFLPVLKGVLKKAKKLEELFMKIQVSLRLGSSGETASLEEAETTFHKFIKQMDKISAYEFNLEVDLLHFVKNSVNDFSIRWKFEITFNSVSYTTSFDSKDDYMKWVKPYHQNLTSTEQKEIIEAFGHKSLHEIKSRVQKNS